MVRSGAHASDGNGHELWRAATAIVPRMSAALRRSGARRSTLRFNTLRFDDIRLDPGRRRVSRGDRLLALTPREFALLELLVRNPERVLTRAEIHEHVWGYDFGRSSNVLGVYVGYLRRKLEANRESRVIHTVRGVGYVLSRRA